MNVFCVDLGTSSLKAALVSDTGECLFFVRIKYSECLPRSCFLSRFSGNFKTTPSLWESAFRKALCILEQNSGYNGVPGGIIISGNGPSLVCLGKNRLKKVLFWHKKIPGKFKKNCGKSLFLPFALYLKSRHPLTFNKIDTILGIPEYLIYALTGCKATILPESRYENAYWTEDILEKLKLKKELFPDFVTPGTQAGTFSATFGNKLYKIPVYYGAPDFISAMLGTGSIIPGKVFDRAGTSEGINLVIPRPPEKTDGLRLLPSVIPDLWNLSYLIPDSGLKFAKLFKTRKYKNLTPEDVIKAVLTKQNLGYNEAEKITREILEELKKGITLLEKASEIKINELTVTGGQGENPFWNQLKADFLNINIIEPTITEGELLGDAVLFFVSTGLYSDIQQGISNLFKIKKIYTPRKAGSMENEPL